MPQLDLYIICTQIFWLLIKFNIFYFFMYGYFFLEQARVMKSRVKFFRFIEDNYVNRGPAYRQYVQILIKRRKARYKRKDWIRKVRRCLKILY
jgi:hypothetical protein